MRPRHDTTSSLDDSGDSGTGRPLATDEADVLPAPSDPAERQELIQSIVTRTRDEHYGDDHQAIIDAINGAIEAVGLPEQPHMWVDATAAEISSGRHVVTDRHLAVSNGEGADQVPAEAHDPDA